MDLITKFLDLAAEAESFAHKLSSLVLDGPAIRAGVSRRQANQARQELTRLLTAGASLLDATADIARPEMQITLSRSYSIAQFFSFRFINQPRIDLADLAVRKFYGSGVYAIYYVGKGFATYAPLRDSETPIYVGKAKPEDIFAETTELQGLAIYDRLKQHSRTISAGGFGLSDFQYRYSTVQSGFEHAVEALLIRIFSPVWNVVVPGFGKHGDSPKTRANRRARWDTLHPGRAWARDTQADQVANRDILKMTKMHLREKPPLRTKSQVFQALMADDA